MLYRPFVAPTRVPDKVWMIVDAPDMQFTHRWSNGDPVSSAIGTGLEIGVANSGAIAPPPLSPDAATPRETRATKAKLRVGGDVLEAMIIKRAMPQYPPLARQMRLSGTVRLQGVIARDGHVANLQVVSGHPMLAAAAVEAVRQWIYRPTLLNGEPVEVIAPIDVRFILSQ